MAPANPDNDSRLTLYPVAAEIGMVAEFAGTMAAQERLPSEELTAIRADIPTQLEWLDAIEAALRELRCREIEDPALIEAGAIIPRLRAALVSPRAQTKSTRALWLCLYGSISLPFLKHFSSAVGDDLGHATAHKIIEVLSTLSHCLNL